MFYAFVLFIVLTVLPLLWWTLPACFRRAWPQERARVRRWWGLCLSGTALWGLAIVIFSDSCLSFSGEPTRCASVLDLPAWLYTAALVYVPLGGVVVPALWVMVFYVAVKRAQRQRERDGIITSD